jgi:uncharacterized membrane protein YgaE (UPF0421/DUF939 family)
MDMAMLVLAIIGSMSALISAIFAFKANRMVKKVYSKMEDPKNEIKNNDNNKGVIAGENIGTIQNLVLRGYSHP